ncbi:MAG TPA: cytochrome c biogenesis protein CcdA [Gaiellales bacterium]|jgi:cytochrome c-type biogenesis protein
MLTASIAFGPVGLSAAFAAGFVSFISPCVWPLMPAYLSFVSGVAYADIGGETRRVTIATSSFVAGFTAAFALAGAGAGLLGGQFLDHRRTLEIVGGVLVIVMGIALAGLAGTRFLQREMRVDMRHAPSGLVGAFLAGLAFAIGWSPCIGPTLTAILALASQGGHAGEGAILLVAYGLGLGVPFLLFGLFFTRALGALTLVRRHNASVMRVAGTLLVVAGTLLALGDLTIITKDLTEWLPGLGRA